MRMALASWKLLVVVTAKPAELSVEATKARSRSLGSTTKAENGEEEGVERFIGHHTGAAKLSRVVFLTLVLPHHEKREPSPAGKFYALETFFLQTVCGGDHSWPGEPSSDKP